MNHRELTKSLFLRIGFTFLFVYIAFQSAKAQENRRFFTFMPISETEFRTMLKKNYNASFVTEIDDSTKLEKAFDAIAKTYNDEEKQLAESELCNSPRCLTSFEAYYPTLDLYLFFIQDLHYEKASFVIAGTNEMASRYRRFRGSYGVMSKDGFWVGLERQDCDNSLQLEICKSSKDGAWSFITFDFAGVDINVGENPVMFWADRNTVYIAIKEYRYEHGNYTPQSQYYAIKFA
jgi:hypothetical protein